jgi:hypothetical protein
MRLKIDQTLAPSAPTRRSRTTPRSDHLVHDGVTLARASQQYAHARRRHTSQDAAHR